MENIVDKYEILSNLNIAQPNWKYKNVMNDIMCIISCLLAISSIYTYKIETLYSASLKSLCIIMWQIFQIGNKI